MPILDAYDLRSQFGTNVEYGSGDVALARAMIRSYTRSVGCPAADEGDWPTDLLAVTHLVATRLHGGDFTRTQETFDLDGEVDQTWFRPFRGFSLVERMMLDRHRQRLM